MNEGLRRRNRRVMFVLLATVAGMVGLTFASAPLYNLFCRMTGYGGTPGIALAPAGTVVDRVITVRFDSTIAPDLPWQFGPAQPPMQIRVGETALAFYRAESRAAVATAGTATYNVTPDKVARYVDKIECFCFTEQTLEAGQSVDMAVSFFVDPAIMDDRRLDDVHTITLSYTFFPKYGTEGGAVAAHAAAPSNGTIE